jgi:hypothetical protein
MELIRGRDANPQSDCDSSESDTECSDIMPDEDSHMELAQTHCS